MTFQVQRIGDSYGVLFTAEQMLQAGLQEGTQVDVQPHTQVEDVPTPVRYVPHDLGMRAYKQTEPQWATAYEELAR